jgi:hypothetical protein
VTGADPHPSKVQGHPVDVVRPDSTAHTVPGLEHHDVPSGFHQVQRCGESCVAGTDDKHLGVGP